MNEFEQFLMENGIDDTEALNAIVQAQPIQPAKPKYFEDVEAHPLEAVIPDMVMNVIKHPWTYTASAVAMLPSMYNGMGLLPSFAKGIGIEKAGEMVDEGIVQAGKLGAHLAQNPGDVNHMLRGLGQSVAELPSRARTRGEDLWKKITQPASMPEPTPSASSSTYTFTPSTPNGKYMRIPRPNIFGE